MQTELVQPIISDEPYSDWAILPKIIDGVLAFREALTGHPLYAYQRVFAYRIIESTLLNDGATISGLWSRQSGKTTTVAETGLSMAILLPSLANLLSNEPGFAFLKPYTLGFLVGIFAPVKDQAQLSYSKMREIAHSARATEIFHDNELNVEVEISRGDTLAFSNGSRIIARSASPDSNIEGGTFHLIFIDEAQKVDRFKVEKEIEPMLASTNGSIVKIGTAWVTRGGFHSDISMNLEVWKRGGKRNHFEFDCNTVIAEKRVAYKKDGNPFHLAYEKYVEQQKKKHGVDSMAFRMNFLLKWQEARLDAISAGALLDAFEGEAKQNVLNIHTPCPDGWFRVAGLDIGKGNDPSVLTIGDADPSRAVVIKGPFKDETVYPKVVKAIFELYGDFEGADGQYSRIVRLVREWGATAVTMDATGMGDPVHERLQNLCPEVDWTGFKYSLQEKSNLFKRFLDEWEGRRIKVASGEESKNMPEFQQCTEQHTNLEAEWKNGYLSCHAPQPAKKSKESIDFEYHDDYPNSFALFCEQVRNGPGNEITSESMPNVGNMRRYQMGGSQNRYQGRNRRSYR